MNYRPLEREVYFCDNEDHTKAARPFQEVEGIVKRVAYKYFMDLLAVLRFLTQMKEEYSA